MPKEQKGRQRINDAAFFSSRPVDGPYISSLTTSEQCLLIRPTTETKKGGRDETFYNPDLVYLPESVCSADGERCRSTSYTGFF